jgi:hypothetical protein
MSILLRDVEPADLPVFFEHQRDPDSIRMAGVPGRELEDFMAHWEKNLADPANVLKTIVSDGDRFPYRARPAGARWATDRSGALAAACVRRLAAFLEHVTERPLYAIVETMPRRVLEKAGFTVCGAEGTTRSTEPALVVAPHLQQARSILPAR